MAPKIRARPTSRPLDRLQHVARLAAALAPDPTEWAYSGEVYDAGPAVNGRLVKCACGHSIRWVFVLVRARDGAKVNVGSVCIESTVPYLISQGAGSLAGSLQSAHEAWAAEIREAERRARVAADSHRVQALAEFRSKLVMWIEEVSELHHRGGYRCGLPSCAYEGIKQTSPASTPGRTAQAMATALSRVAIDILDWLRIERPTWAPCLPRLHPDVEARVRKMAEGKRVESEEMAGRVVSTADRSEHLSQAEFWRKVRDSGAS